jgi:Leucine-rich repeat (LRR) protein
MKQSAARPQTAAKPKMSQQQQQVLSQMKRDSEQAVLISHRPRTAATTTVFDESRIKDKIKYLDHLEDSLNTDIERILKTDIAANKKSKVKLTKQMLLENSMCDDLNEVQTLMLRDKGIDVFKLADLFSLECLLASHNHISDVFGISQLTSLIELNLSFNNLSDLTGIESLHKLQSLHLNRNNLTIITPIE